jgi:serine/threonine protein kinase
VGQINPGLIVAGRYRLLRKLGQGGMGTVWSARNELIDREVAIKMMRPEAAANPVSLQRFFTEAKASGRLRHPNITEIFDLGQAEDGSPFLVLELLTGEALDSVLRRVPTLAPVQTLLLGRAVASGLNVAHAKGIIHRDLKPANVFLHRDPITLDVIPKILDFGISKVTGPEAVDHHATHTGTVVGSPTYMSPEQARGVSDIDARADIWSLAVLMYKCLTGRAPFNAANYNALMVAIMTEPHPPIQKFAPGVPKSVSDIVDECLRKDRNERIQSAKAFVERIDRALLGLNAERAKLELPSDDLDDDMPTIARGDRDALLAQVQAATGNDLAPAPAPPMSAPPSPTPQPAAFDTSPTNAPAVVSQPLFGEAPLPVGATQKLPAQTVAAKSSSKGKIFGISAGVAALIATLAFVGLRAMSGGASGKDTAAGKSSKVDDDKSESSEKPSKKKAADDSSDDDVKPTKKKGKPADDDAEKPAPSASTTAAASASASTTAAAATTATTPSGAGTTASTATGSGGSSNGGGSGGGASTASTSKPTPLTTAKPSTGPKKVPVTKVDGPGF